MISRLKLAIRDDIKGLDLSIKFLRRLGTNYRWMVGFRKKNMLIVEVKALFLNVGRFQFSHQTNCADRLDAGTRVLKLLAVLEKNKPNLMKILVLKIAFHLQDFSLNSR